MERPLLSRLLFLGLAAIVCGCSDNNVDDDPPDVDKPFLIIRASLPTVVASGGKESIMFSTNRAWRFERELQHGDDDYWFTFTPVSGTAGEQIVVTVFVDPNEAYTGRSAALVLRTVPDGAHAEETVLEERITVEQGKKNVILLGDTRREVGSGEQTLTVEVQSNVDYTVTVEEGSDWIGELPDLRAAEGLEGKTHHFTIAANPDPEERIGVIVFTDTASELSDALTVVQAPRSDPDPERTALQAIFESAGGGGWTRGDNWNSDKPLGEWYGVETDAQGHVTALRLPRNNLCGTISEKIALLTYLQHLDLSWNELEGIISLENGSDQLHLSNLKHLETINLSHNHLEGGTAIDWYKLEQLRTLDLSSNRLKYSAIPVQWASMFDNGKMVELVLNDNSMWGTIPQAIQNHPEWGRLALQMIRQNQQEGGGLDYQRDIVLPDFTFTDLRDGTRHSIRDVYSANKLTMLLAWDPRHQESNTFMETTVRRLHTLYGAQGFAVVAIAPDEEACRQDVEQYLLGHEVAWPVVADYVDNRGRRMILPSYPYPSCLMVDQTGKVTEDFFTGRRLDYAVDADRIDMCSFTQADILSAFMRRSFGKSAYRSTDFSRDKTFETLQTATRGKGIDIVLIGDAFTDIDIETGFYKQLMEYAMEAYFSLEPLKSYREYFNVRMVYAVSRNSYIGDDRSMSALQTMESSWRGDGHIDPYFSVINSYLSICPQPSHPYRFASILINGYDRGVTYMNSTGANFSFSCYRPGGWPTDQNVLLHEGVGHGFGCLADEYDNYVSGGGYEITDTEKQRLKSGQAKGWFENVSLSNDAKQVPWSHLIGHPRYPNVGMFEGGFYFVKGVWRSERESIMLNDRSYPYFNAFCRELIVRRIMHFAGEEYSFENFLEKDKDDRQAHQQSPAWCYPRRQIIDYEHVPPVFAE